MVANRETSLKFLLKIEGVEKLRGLSSSLKKSFGKHNVTATWGG